MSTEDEGPGIEQEEGAQGVVESEGSGARGSGA